MRIRMKKSESGFSLVELMVVVGIIGILASLALPRLQIFMAKAKQSEAKTSLSALNSLHQSYYAENNTYGPTVAALGWATPAGARYTLSTDSGGIGTALSGTTGATAICSPQNNADTWTMTPTKVLANVSTLATTCP